MEMPDELPVMTLPNATLFPHAMLPLYIFEERYKQMLTDVLDLFVFFGVVAQQAGGGTLLAVDDEVLRRCGTCAQQRAGCQSDRVQRPHDRHFLLKMYQTHQSQY